MLYQSSSPSPENEREDSEITFPAVVINPLEALRSAADRQESLGMLSEDPFIFFLTTPSGAHAVYGCRGDITNLFDEIGHQALDRRQQIPSLYYVRGLALIDHATECAEATDAITWCRSLLETLSGMDSLVATRYRALIGFRLAYLHGVNPDGQGDGMDLLRHVVALATRRRELMHDRALTTPLTDIVSSFLPLIERLTPGTDQDLLSSAIAWRDLLKEHQKFLLKDRRPSLAPFALSEAGCRVESVLILMDLFIDAASSVSSDYKESQARLILLSSNIENSGPLIREVQKATLFLSASYSAVKIASILDDGAIKEWCCNFAKSRVIWAKEILSTLTPEIPSQYSDLQMHEDAMKDLSYLENVIINLSSAEG